MIEYMLVESISDLQGQRNYETNYFKNKKHISDNHLLQYS